MTTVTASDPRSTKPKANGRIVPFDNRVRDEIKSRIDLVELIGESVPLRRAGGRWKALCPFHEEKTPSFTVSSERRTFHCFGCGAHGDAFTFLMRRNGVSFPDALRILAERAGVELPTPARPQRSRATQRPTVDPLIACRFAAAQYLRQALRGPSPQAEQVRSYLAARGLADVHLPLFPLGALDSQDLLRRALLAAGCSAGAIAKTGLLEPYMAHHPLIFLFTDGHEVTGFKGRVPDRAVKEVKNAKGFGGPLEGRSLFGLELADEAIAEHGRAILVEGEFDALTLQSALLRTRGVTVELVALGGNTKPTAEKFRILRDLGAEIVYLALDGDRAGARATAAALPLAWGEGLGVFVLPMPPGIKDPDEAVSTLGAARCLSEVFTLSRAVPGAAWLASYVVKNWNVKSTSVDGGRSAVIEMGQMVPRGDRDAFLVPVAEALGEPLERLRAEVIAAARAARERRMRQRLSAWAQELSREMLSGGPLDEAIERARRVLDEASRETDQQSL